MKQIVVFLYLLLSCISAFSFEIHYKVKQNAEYDDHVILTNDVLIWNSETSRFFVYDDSYKNDCYLLIADLIKNNRPGFIAKNSDVDIIGSEKFIKNKYIRLLPVYYLDVLKNKSADLIYSYQPEWQILKNNYIGDWGNDFEDTFWPENIIISNTFCRFSEHDFFLVKNAEKKSNSIKVQLYRNRDSLKYKNEVPHPKLYSKYSEKNEITILLEFDGDFVDVWINSDEEYLGKYFITERETCLEISTLVQTNIVNIENFNWPRHADGSCDYDGSKKTAVVQTQKTTPSTNIAPNKTMTVKENLKLRSGEATTTQVLTVMSVGTKVKILELGKAETIDGINSNWVKVEVQADAKDRDGKTIKKGTVGWCYGGYLE